MIDQITLEDYWHENYSFGAKCRKEGYTNVYDAMPDHPCKVYVIDHDGNRFRSEVVRSGEQMAFHGADRGYDICWWKEVPQYRYGMRLRGFSPGCQPMRGLEDVTDGEGYHNILIYSRQLTDKEIREYELDFLGEKDERGKIY